MLFPHTLPPGIQTEIREIVREEVSSLVTDFQTTMQGVFQQETVLHEQRLILAALIQAWETADSAALEEAFGTARKLLL